MEREHSEIFQQLSDVVLVGNYDESANLAKKVIAMGINPTDAIIYGLSEGMRMVSRKYDEKEYFIPELMRAAKTMNIAIDVLKPHIKMDSQKKAKKIVIGTVKGDIHDIGKNIVIMVLKASGYQVFDLGVSVDSAVFVEKTKELKPDVLAMSSLLTTTFLEMEKIIKSLDQARLRNDVKVIVGGAPVTQKFADSIGADAFGMDAVDTVKKLENLFRQG